MTLRIISCFCFTFVSNGLARFGYVLLIPLMILSGKFSQAQSFQLGIAILLGYIFGASIITIARRFVSLECIAKISLFAISLSFFVCALDVPFVISWVFRFLAGVSSAALMILAGPLSLPYIKERSRSLVSGFVFSGIGVGAVLCGFVLPFIASINLVFCWYFLAITSFVCFVVASFSLPALNPAIKNLQDKNLATKNLKNENLAHSNPANTPATRKLDSIKSKYPLFLWLLVISYSLNAIGYLPHTLFWLDFLVRELKISSASAGHSWVFFGIGSIFGSVISGILGERVGVKNASYIVLGVKTIACFLPIISSNLFILDASVFIMGFSTTGNVALTNALALQIAQHSPPNNPLAREHFAHFSSFLTFCFGIFQGAFSFIFVYFLDSTINPWGYFSLFLICTVCLFFSIVVLMPIKKYDLHQ